MLNKITEWVLGLVGLLMYYPTIIKIVVKKEVPIAKFTNVRNKNGKKINLVSFTKDFVLEHKPLDMISDQGNLAMIHGNPGGSYYSNEGFYTSNRDIAKFFNREGNYTLISCHNAHHSDFVDNGREFKREPITCTPFPIIALVIYGTMYIFSSKESYAKILKTTVSNEIVDWQIKFLEDFPIPTEEHKNILA